MNNKIKVSVITASYNNFLTINDTINSILNQNYNNIEYIIIDGQSNDGTLDLIKKRESEIKGKLTSFVFISEKDKGIADAWNKGLKLAKGEIIFFLNSDDWIDRNTILKGVELLNENELELSYGICTRINERKEEIESFQKTFFKYREFWNFGFSFTTCFITKKVYEKIGGFNTNYKIAIDSNFLLKCIKNGVKFKKSNHVTFMRLGGVSTKFRKAAHKEYKKALIDNGYSIFLVNICYFFFKRT